MFMNGIVNKDGKIVTQARCKEVCTIQKYNQLTAALPQKWTRQLLKRKEFIVLSSSNENLAWPKMTGINCKMYQFHLKSSGLITMPLQIQDGWEQVFHVPKPWHRVSELIYKTTTEASIRSFQLKLLYKSAPLMMAQHAEGCLRSPFLFLVAIDWIMRKTTGNRRNGIQWFLWTQFDDLNFAGDLALLSHIQ